MKNCDFCNNPADLIIYSAAQIRDAADSAGLSPKATMADFCALFEIPNIQLVYLYQKGRMDNPEMDWELCPTCAAKVEQHLTRNPGGAKQWWHFGNKNGKK